MDKKLRPLLILPLFALSSCASQEDLVVVREDVQKVKTQTAGSYSDVQRLRDEVSQLQGRIEEISHNNAQTFGRLGMEDSLLVHKVDEMDARLQKIEQYLAIGTAGSLAAPKQQPEQVKTADVPPTDSAILKDGIDKLGMKKYSAARESFTSLIRKFPKSDLADDAQFNIGESYFNEKWYEKAILEYQGVIEKYPKSNKRPAALYRQALAFEMIGDAANAQERFRDIVNLYPKSSEAVLARKKMK
jgi:tol-pal system protein YbgF